MNSGSSSSIAASYDRPVDVLYLVLDAVPCEGEGVPGGIELDYAEADGAPCGVTVFGFHRNGWDKNLQDLAAIAARHLQFDTARVRTAILAATGLGG
jgi:hypothetical protein